MIRLLRVFDRLREGFSQDHGEFKVVHTNGEFVVRVPEDILGTWHRYETTSK